MEICKVPTLGLEALNKHSITYIMYIEMENVISIDFINPFTAVSCTFFRAEKCTQTRLQTVFDGPRTNLFLILCVWTEILSRAHVKGAGGALMI